jgi:hypothetical protein
MPNQPAEPFRFDHPHGLVTPGLELPQIQLRLTLQRLVMEAGANRDFAPSHHDATYARERGANAAFANFEFVACAFERLIREYTGPTGFLEFLEFRLEGNATAGTTISAGGEITGVHVGEGRDTLIELDVWQRSDGAETARGRARVRLAPAGGRS